MNNCFKCGNELDNNYRCCMSCGAINPNHPDNKQTVEFLKNKGNINVNVTNNTNVVTNAPNNEVVVKDNSVFSITLFAIVNCVGFVILLLFLLTKNNDITYNLIMSSIIYFYFVCFQLLLRKADLPWWGIFIPIYNLYLINKLAFGNGWSFIILFAPLILLIICALLNLLGLLAFITKLWLIILYFYPIVFTFCLGKRFGRSGILTLILAFIIIPSMALSNKYQYCY